MSEAGRCRPPGAARGGSPVVIPRSEIESTLVESALARQPGVSDDPRFLPPVQLLLGPRGAGKSTLLKRLAATLAGRRAAVALADLEQVGAGPEDLARWVPDRVIRAARVAGAEPGAQSAAVSRDLQEEMDRRRPDPQRLLDLALAYPEAMARDLGGPLVIILDELGEAARACRRPGLRQGPGIIARRIAASGSVSFVASVSAASRAAPLLALLEQECAGAGRSLALLELPPLSPEEVSVLLAEWGCPSFAEETTVLAWMKATGGRPLWMEILARRIFGGGSPGPDPADYLASAIAAEMRPPHGGFHRECRFDYHVLVERSRGDAAVRTILRLLGREEGLNLSAIASRLHISLPTALDYLSWLLEVGLLRRDGRGYVFADPLLRLWLILHGPEEPDPVEAAVRFMQRPALQPMPPPRARGRRAAPPRATVRAPVAEIEIFEEPAGAAPRPDPSERLMEID